MLDMEIVLVYYFNQCWCFVQRQYHQRFYAIFHVLLLYSFGVISKQFVKISFNFEGLLNKSSSLVGLHSGIGHLLRVAPKVGF